MLSYERLLSLEAVWILILKKKMQAFLSDGCFKRNKFNCLAIILATKVILHIECKCRTSPFTLESPSASSFFSLQSLQVSHSQ